MIHGSFNYRDWVTSADLHYARPVEESHDGLPIGNGTMGTLLWTAGHSLRMQINRVDVHANGCTTKTFNKRHKDYAYGCGFVALELGTCPAPVFGKQTCVQHLSMYDGIARISGHQVSVEVGSRSVAELRRGAL